MNPREVQKFRIREILVPLLILVAVIFMWILKNNSISQEENTFKSDNPDFELYAQADFDFESLFEYNLPIVLDFGASWCGPCQLMKPVLEKMNKDLQGQVIIKYIDVDELPEFSAEFPITVVPTQFFFMADGTPYIPGENAQVDFRTYKLADTGAHALTAHEGYLDEAGLLLILEEMGFQISGGTPQ